MRLAFIIGIVFFALLCMPASQAQSLVEDDRQAEVAKLLDEALSATSPEAQIKIYREILQIDPTNQNAFNGIKEAEQKIQQQQKDREKSEAEKQQQEHQERQRADGVRAADKAVAAGDVVGARTALDAIRKIAPADANIVRIDSDIQALVSYRNMVWAAVGTAMALLIAAFGGVFLFFRRRTLPYLEVLEGAEPGKRYTLDKDVTLVGSVAKFEELPNDIVLPDEDGRIAKGHCEIHHKDKKLWVIDSHSREGTFVDGKKLDPPEKPVRLRSGARLDFGHAEVFKVGFARKKA